MPPLHTWQSLYTFQAVLYALETEISSNRMYMDNYLDDTDRWRDEHNTSLVKYDTSTTHGIFFQLAKITIASIDC